MPDNDNTNNNNDNRPKDIRDGEEYVVILFSQNDGSGFAELPIVVTDEFKPGVDEFDDFVLGFAEANDLAIESLNDEFLTDEQFYNLLNKGVID